MKKEQLTFKETMAEGKYLATLTKEQKKEYKKLSVEEKRKILSEIIQEESKKPKKKYKKYVAIVSILGAMAIGSCAIGDYEEDEQPKENKQEQKVEKKEKVAKEKKVESKKPLTDKQKVKKAIKKERDGVKDVDIYDGEITVTMEVRDNFTKKSELLVMKDDTAKALIGVKKSGVPFNSVVVMMEKEDAVAMSSRWSAETVNGLDKDASITLKDNMDMEAEQVNIHSYYR